MRLRSPRMPPGRAMITPTISAPTRNSRKLAWPNSPGRDWVATHIAQTTKAPRIAPLLLAVPPTISIAQITKVAKSGSKVSGDRKRTWCAYSAPPMPMITAPSTNALSLNANTSLPLASAAVSSSRMARSTRPQGELTARCTAR